jgi:hypothetical protein
MKQSLNKLSAISLRSAQRASYSGNEKYNGRSPLQSPFVRAANGSEGYAFQDFFTLSCLIKDLNQYFLVYNKFGLSSHLNACNAVSNLRSSYVGSNNLRGGTLLQRTEYSRYTAAFEGLNTTRSVHEASMSNTLLSLEMLLHPWSAKRTVTTDSGDQASNPTQRAAKLLNLSLVAGPTSQSPFVRAANGSEGYAFQLNAVTRQPLHSNLQGTTCSEPKVSEGMGFAHYQSIPQVSPFKLSRDYTFDEEGFED